MIALLSRTLGSQLLLANDLATDRLHTWHNHWLSMRPQELNSLLAHARCEKGRLQ